MKKNQTIKQKQVELSKEKSLVQELQTANREIETLAKQAGLSPERVIQILQQRELVIISKQVACMHEHLDRQAET
jgi:type II secretory pathway component PulM